jgi:hypothetical protein
MKAKASRMQAELDHLLLVPPWSDQTLIDRFDETGSQHGFQLVRSALLDSCIL